MKKACLIGLMLVSMVLGDFSNEVAYCERLPKEVEKVVVDYLSKYVVVLPFFKLGAFVKKKRVFSRLSG